MSSKIELVLKFLPRLFFLSSHICKKILDWLYKKNRDPYEIPSRFDFRIIEKRP